MVGEDIKMKEWWWEELKKRDDRIWKVENEAIHWKAKLACIADLVTEYKSALATGIDTNILELIEDLELIIGEQSWMKREIIN